VIIPRSLLATLTAAAVLTATTADLARADTPAAIPAMTVAVTPDEDAMLARWHDMADPAADAAVDDLYAKGEIDAANTALNSWTTNAQPLPAGLPPKLRDFLAANLALPSFTDQPIVRRAAVFQADHWVAFLDASVLGSAPSRTRYPGITAGLVRDLGPAGDTPESGAKASRIVTALMSADPLGPTGELLVTALKVRLVHAAGRHLLHQNWDYKRFGPPISKLYMAAEYQTFTIEVIDALARIGAPMSASQAQDFIDVWRVIGTILGLPIDAMPPTVAQTRHLGDVLNARLEDISTAAKSYVAGNIAAQAKFFEPPIPPAAGGPFFAALTRKTLGDTDADAFGIPRDRFWDSVADAALPALAGGLGTGPWPSSATLYTPILATVLRMMLDDAKNADIVLPPAFHPVGRSAQ
jgi:ER-bound oxygenase mpaB/B'/Rubber oxygenase, catalytic domain